MTNDSKAKPVRRRSRLKERRQKQQELSSDAANVSTGPAYIKRKIPYLNFAEEESLQLIENHVDWLLKEVGVEFRDDPVAINIWRKAGADIQGVRVRCDSEMVRELLSTAPSEFIQHARNKHRSVIIGGKNAVFAPVYGPPFVRCLQHGRRYGTLEDFEKLVKLTYSLPGLHHSGGVTCEPCDVPVNKRHLDMVYRHLKYSDKPFLGAITEQSRAADSIAMARIVFGAQFMQNNCVIMGNVNANSPLMFDKVASEAIHTYCEANQAIVVAPFILGGAMGPVTTAGAIAQALAEGMAAGAYSQLVRRGAPFVLGNFLSSMSLRSGAPTFGMPEPVMSNYVIGQLARRLKLPLRCGGSLTASKLPDAQAAYESADSMHATALGGANFVLHSAGWLESGLVTSFEKLVMDADRLAAYGLMLEGISTSENGLGKNAYSDVEPGGHFLGSGHTLANYETAYFESSISHSESFEQWSEEGGKDAMVRANEYWRQLLEDYQQPQLDQSVDEELKSFIADKKASMSDMWY